MAEKVVIGNSDGKAIVSWRHAQTNGTINPGCLLKKELGLFNPLRG
jgi:hypothetical protein